MCKLSGRHSFMVLAVAVSVAGSAITAWAALPPADSDDAPQVQRSQPAASATGRLTGVLTDQSGGVIANARVEVSSRELNLTWTAFTDQRGRYLVGELPQGRYQVAALSPGFETSTRDAAAVSAGEDTAVDLVLLVARQEHLVVVMASPVSGPLTVETDPRAPRQPIPAHDGADYLKAIPGFSVVRKGGTDGDPVLRGMSGSRVGVLLDGQQILGGCGGRMDPPTAYVFPAAYDRITVLKGPQTVMYGPGASAGTVLFERHIQRVDRPNVKIASAFTGGSFGRNDEMADVRAAVPSFYLQGAFTRSHADDYTDGNGAAVHSVYTRWNGNVALGWTPDTSTQLELSLARSHGEAAYADRGMDGLFDRDNVAIKFDRRFNSRVPPQDRGPVVLQLHRSRDGQLHAPDSGNVVLGDESGSGDRGRARRSDARAPWLDDDRAGWRRPAQRAHGPGRDWALIRSVGDVRPREAPARRGRALYPGRPVCRGHPGPHGAQPPGRRLPERLALGAGQPRVRRRLDVPRRLAPQERHPWRHRPQDPPERFWPLRARHRCRKPDRPPLGRGRAHRAVPGLLGATQAGSGHAQERVPHDSARR